MFKTSRTRLGWAVLLLLAAAGCQETNQWSSCSSDAECGPDQRCLAGTCRPWSATDGGVDADGPLVDSGPECASHPDCDGGFCIAGRCCPTEERICGQSCCQPYETCFAQACVVPGVLCHSTFDCEEGEYCELSLGGDGGADADADAEGPDDADVEGPGDADAGLCLYPPPRSGRCLDLPPECPTGVRPDEGTSCIPECEYHQEIGPLNAEQRWRWGPEAVEFPNHIDVWATPTVGRLTDTNCDGLVNELDPPAVVVVTGNGQGTCCQCTDQAESACQTGVLRVLDGLTGREIWSLRRAEEGSLGFAGTSVALGHLIDEGGLEGGATTLDIAAVTGEGRIAVIGSEGDIYQISERVVAGWSGDTMGWGGGLALGDMDGDGHPEIAHCDQVFTTAGEGLPLLFEGGEGIGGNARYTCLSFFVDLDAEDDGRLELLAGHTAYRADGTALWHRDDLPDGFSAVGDFNRDGDPEAVLVAGGRVWVLAGRTGETLLGPTTLPSDGHGGPPTVADFDGDGFPEIGVAQKSFYAMLKPDMTISEVRTEWLELEVVWQAPNHDLSSSVTGSTVFDFEGDGAAEVIYNDECFLWVYDGSTGAVRFATPTTSFTGTESALLADVDGDGHAEMLMISNGADPSASGWGCDTAPWNQPDGVRPAWAPPPGETAWRGITLFGDRANSWVGTRTLWNQHSYHVSNICDHRDDACDDPNVYGGIPRQERQNWMIPWLNNFRQNVQDQGIYDAPDATVRLEVLCTEPVELRAFLRNLGAALLPAGVEVGFFVLRDGSQTPLGSLTTAAALYPGQVSLLSFVPGAELPLTSADTFLARVLTDPFDPLFHECDEGNNASAPAQAVCLN